MSTSENGTAGARPQDPALPSHDPLFEDPLDSPPVLDASWQRAAPPVPDAGLPRPVGVVDASPTASGEPSAAVLTGGPAAPPAAPEVLDLPGPEPVEPIVWSKPVTPAVRDTPAAAADPPPDPDLAAPAAEGPPPGPGTAPDDAPSSGVPAKAGTGSDEAGAAGATAEAVDGGTVTDGRDGEAAGAAAAAAGVAAAAAGTAAPDPGTPAEAPAQAAAANPPVAEPAAPAEPAERAADSYPAAVRPGPRVDTGRLFRSIGAEGTAASAAIPALDAATLASLRSVAGGRGAGPDMAAEPAAASAAGAVLAAPAAAVPETRGLTATGVWVVLVGVTVLLAFADVLLRGSGDPWWIAGIGLVVASGYAALTVRPLDLWVAVIAPPLAFLVAVLTAGQLTLGSGGSLLLREAAMVFQKLSFNAPFIFAATALALVIVLVRRHRFRRDQRSRDVIASPVS